MAHWLGLIEPARCEACAWGQRRGPATPGESNTPSPGHKHSTHLQLQQPGDKGMIPRADTAPNGVESTLPLMVDLPGLI